MEIKERLAKLKEWIEVVGDGKTGENKDGGKGTSAPYPSDKEAQSKGVAKQVELYGHSWARAMHLLEENPTFKVGEIVAEKSGSPGWKGRPWTSVPGTFPPTPGWSKRKRKSSWLRKSKRSAEGFPWVARRKLRRSAMKSPSITGGSRRTMSSKGSRWEGANRYRGDDRRRLQRFLAQGYRRYVGGHAYGGDPQ